MAVRSGDGGNCWISHLGGRESDALKEQDLYWRGNDGFGRLGLGVQAG